MVPGVDGTIRVTPDAGTGRGRGRLKLSLPVAIDEGVAPAASTAAEAVPVISVLPRACAADAIEDGIISWVW